ncbi:hypothetical protein HK098_007480 [Nowakowskiella sp. JEL0407]|nr:hypothetical protein HK098_007480 [Nowakowskiella sp. JEL0407]
MDSSLRKRKSQKPSKETEFRKENQQQNSSGFGWSPIFAVLTIAILAGGYFVYHDENMKTPILNNINNIIRKTRAPAAMVCENITPAYREDCGNIKTTQATCVASGCCWNPPPAGVAGPACYKNVKMPAIPPQCANVLRAELRVDCGDLNITPALCFAKGCCWDVYPPLPGDWPNCYKYPEVVPPGPLTPTLEPTTKNPGSFEIVGKTPSPGFHVAVVPKTGKLVFYDRISGGTLGTHTYEWDYILKQYRELTSPPTDVFCSGGSILPDNAGRILNVGGWAGAGLEKVRFYTGCGTPGVWGTCDGWVEADTNQAKLLLPRWYPTTVTLPNGTIAVLGGTTGMLPGGKPQTTIEFLPKIPGVGTLTLPILANNLDYLTYVNAFVLPNGGVWVLAGAQNQVLDYTNDWKILRAYPNAPGAVARTYPLTGQAVLLPLDPANNYKAEVLVCGGGNEYLPTSKTVDTCVRLDLDAQDPQWVTETMPTGPRVMPDIILLPDGTQLILNGAATGGSGFNYARFPVLNALLYDPKKPANQRFTVLAASTIPRMYHSVALLLEDGRVLVAASNPNANGNLPSQYVEYESEFRVEYYTPPYLSTGAVRPEIENLPVDDWDYADTLQLTAKIPSEKKENIRLVLTTDGFVTHSTHMNQRQVVIAFTSVKTAANEYVLTLTTPPNANVCPPGWYMLFVLDNGVPSIAKWVRVGGDPSGTTTWLTKGGLSGLTTKGARTFTPPTPGDQFQSASATPGGSQSSTTSAPKTTGGSGNGSGMSRTKTIGVGLGVVMMIISLISLLVI